MKIAVVSDIHGNNIALKEVLEEVNDLRIKTMFILGDSVGYYYHADAVLKLLKKYSIEMIKGNFEEILIKAYHNKQFAARIKVKYGSSINLTIDKLKRAELNMIKKLPNKKIVMLDSLKFLLCHGSPWDVNYYIYPNTNINILNKCLSNNMDFVLLGHTHYSFAYQKNNVFLLNPGSVGQNRQKGGIAQWIMIDTSNASVIFQNTPYKTENLINEVEKIDPQITYLSEVLKR